MQCARVLCRHPPPRRRSRPRGLSARLETLPSSQTAPWALARHSSCCLRWPALGARRGAPWRAPASTRKPKNTTNSRHTALQCAGQPCTVRGNAPKTRALLTQNVRQHHTHTRGDAAINNHPDTPLQHTKKTKQRGAPLPLLRVRAARLAPRADAADASPREQRHVGALPRRHAPHHLHP